jgi:hypothetical protein
MSYCVQEGTGDDAKKVCTAFGAIENGKQITPVQMNVCKSWNTYTNEDKTFCVQADTSDNDPSKASVALDTKCNFKTFTDAADLTTGDNPALCGFNKDDQAWCPLLKGDAPFTTPLGKYQTLIASLRDKCNIGSTGIGSCNNAKSNEDMTTNVDFQTASSLLPTQVGEDTNMQGWPNVADNEGCTKDTYTLYFYSGNAVAMTAAAVGALAMLF